MLRRAKRTIAGGLCLFLFLPACTDMGGAPNSSGDDSSAGQAGDDTGTDSQAGDDSNTDSSRTGDAPADSTGTSRPDGGGNDTGLDAGVTVVDATIVDATVDSSLPDAGPAANDAGDAAAVMDAAVEAGAHDAGVDATVDAAAHDPGPDAGIDASRDAAGDVAVDAPAAVDAPPDAAPESSMGGGAQCAGSIGGVCTPTEALFAEHAPSCYACLLMAGCLDDAPMPVSFNDTLHECSDVTGNTLVASKTRTQACLDVIACTLAHSSAQPTLAFGYCGVQPTTVSCQTATPGQTGPCLVEEQTGLESSDPNTVLGRYTNQTYGAGMANQVFQCATSNLCTTCL